MPFVSIATAITAAVAAAAKISTNVAGGVMENRAMSAAGAESRQMYDESIERDERDKAFDRRMSIRGQEFKREELEMKKSDIAYNRRMGKKAIRAAEQQNFGNQLVNRANQDEQFKSALWARWGRRN